MYDVAVIGGGLAGLTLALQVTQARPELRVVVFERNAFPVPEAAHKVGEATVEIGAHYLADTLGLRNYLETNHLQKFGLRLFFGAGLHSDLANADELGASSLLPAISYQLDRGRLENDLARMLIQRGVEVRDRHRVKNVTVDCEKGHRLTVKSDDQIETVRCEWLVDASARAGVLKRMLNLGQAEEHGMCAAWFRIRSEFSVDDWSGNHVWRNRCRGASRRPSTNHLMGSGYWVWIIPLAGGYTSIGVVTDPSIHPLDSYDSYEKLVGWFGTHQPALASQLRGAEALDFMKLRNLAHGCAKTWSTDKWCLTGEAGYFSDPFYSPGTDFIGLSNTYITDLITRDCTATELGIRAAIYQKSYLSIFSSTMSLYRDQYAGFGDSRLMAVKLTWDYFFYWAVLAWLFFRDALTDLDFLRRAQPEIEHIRAINDTMQAAFRKRAALAIVDPGSARFFDQNAIPLLVELNAALLEQPESRLAELQENRRKLEKAAPKLLSLLAGKSIGHCAMLGDFEERLAAS